MQHRAARGNIEARQQIQQRAFAAATGADNRGDPTRFKVNADIAQRDDGTLAARVDLRDSSSF